jgi:hypothetical protein
MPLLQPCYYTLNLRQGGVDDVMLEFISKDFLALVTFLLPGFLSAWVFYGLTSHPKPSQFERTIQALIFTFIVQAFIPVAGWILKLIGGYVSFGQWDLKSETASSLVLAIILGSLLAYFTNNDSFHARLRKWGFTTRTSHPSEWFYVFSQKVTYIILHLKDGRRLYGWPKEWPIEAGKGQFYIMQPTWILDDRSQSDLPELDGILVSASDVLWVEFLNKSETADEQ